ncbi:S26 family signal peptidase [Nocardia terpenica]|uniref:S26 family signal peptidase n=1 Tax=Nocardia terpenica TaxID=455432 RepID=UPI001933F9D6|nr:S26 family signal peptidase [Nocardia terpenica]
MNRPLLCGVPVLVLGLALARAVLGRRFVAVTVRGASMEPTYRHGDRVLVRRTAAAGRGQVVVVGEGGAAHPLLGSRSWQIKRVAGVSGDPVPRECASAVTGLRPSDRVPDGKLVLLGDNPRVSVDSRQQGYFPADWVLGTVIRPLSGGSR